MIYNYLPTYMPTNEPTANANYMYQPAMCPSLPMGNASQPSEQAIEPPKPKRTRTAFNGIQLVELEREFKRNMYMFRHHRILVAQRLSLRENQVKVWFQNRRMRHKKETRGQQEKKSNAKSALTQNEPNGHQEIVQRLMSYSQDPTAQRRPRAARSHAVRAAERPHNLQRLAIAQQPTRIATPRINTGAAEFTEILNFLQAPATQQTFSEMNISHDLDMVLQSLNNEVATRHVQQVPTPHASTNYYPYNSL